MNNREKEVARHLAIIEKGCDELVDRDHLAERLAQGATLRVKFGMDPSGRSKTRRPMTREEVLKNAETYQTQLFRILDPSRTEIRFNSQWLSSMRLEEVLRMMATTTVAQMLEREDFSKRMSECAPIGLHEFLYPLMQVQDSVALQADLELGGTDRRFNILMGHGLQRHAGQPPQSALFMPLLSLGLMQAGTASDPLALLVGSRLATSRSEARRWIRQGGVRLNGEPLQSENPRTFVPGDIFRCGRKGYVRLVDGDALW